MAACKRSELFEGNVRSRHEDSGDVVDDEMDPQGSKKPGKYADCKSSKANVELRYC
jgi:hypothetical protein